MLKKIWSLLNSSQRRATILLVGLTLIGMVLETLGIGMVLPVIALMTQQEDLVTKYPFLEPILEALGNPTHIQLIIGSMLLLVGVYTIKVLFLAFLAWWQMRFTFGLQADISQRLFAHYLHQPYIFHLQRNSSQLIRNVVGEINILVSKGLKPLLEMFTQMSMLIGISILLLITEPIGALVIVTVLSFSGWIFYYVTRKRVLNWGKARQFHDSMRLQHIRQGLGGVKDVKLLGREDEFIHSYQEHNSWSARIAQRQATLQALPRLWLEILVTTGMAGLVLTMILQGKPLNALLPTLGLFTAAAFRLLPMVSNILAAIHNLRFALPAIDTLHNEMLFLDKYQDSENKKPLPFHKEISLEQVAFFYPSTETPALFNINLSISKETTVGFIGDSGSGKSSLIDIMLGLLTPSSGTVKVDGIDIQTNLRGWQDQIGYVPQSIYLTDDTLRRNIAFGVSNDQIDESAVWKAIQTAQLETFVNSLPQGLNTKVGERGVRLSGGQRQRIGIARALYHDPPVLVLDEATSSLDINTERGVMESIRLLHGSKTILIVAHRLSTVENCDYLYRLEQGKIVEEGKAEQVLMMNC